jgi:hypothetical protein
MEEECDIIERRSQLRFVLVSLLDLSQNITTTQLPFPSPQFLLAVLVRGAECNFFFSLVQSFLQLDKKLDVGFIPV